MAREVGDTAGEAHKRKVASAVARAAEDKRPAIERLFSAWSDLRNEGWQDIMYAPKNGTEIEVICCGSTGIHKAAWLSFGEGHANGSFFVDGEWPEDPVLFRPIKT